MAKRGRKPTGRLRPCIVQIGVTTEENEFIARIAYNNGYSASVYGRMRMLPNGWRDKLFSLRQSQNGVPLIQLDRRRRKE